MTTTKTLTEQDIKKAIAYWLGAVSQGKLDVKPTDVSLSISKGDRPWESDSVSATALVHE